MIMLASIVWSTARIFNKKPIALTALSVVIKYSLIGAILLYVTQFTDLSGLWVGLGVVLMLPTLSISAIISAKYEGNWTPDDDEGVQ